MGKFYAFVCDIINASYISTVVYLGVSSAGCFSPSL
nr:MAG TPA: hypothetical protein [Caudoviricetes sp.]